ncbi:MAG: imidazole glycerol phosphate synthase subunit HisH [Ruminococcaceae bacterium]|nr:imidazole glycerol phosphate synthase subunit HisH [Oscillospiraceae bacterium]
MVGIIDYGVGNLFSLKSSLAYLGINGEIVSDEKSIAKCDRIILPGVGAFGDASKALQDTKLDKVVIDIANKGVPLLGICLGMQLLFEEGLEFGSHKGLGLIPGKVVSIEPLVNGNKIPHIGWNALQFSENKGDIYKYTKDGEFVYFVHSFHAECPSEYITARSEYGSLLTASVQKGNVMGAQYHPEKSGESGLMILKSFCEI